MPSAFLLLETSQPGIFAVGGTSALALPNESPRPRRRGRDGDPACCRTNTPHLGGNGDARDGLYLLERFFQAAYGVDVDRDDIKRYLDFVNDALYDLLLIGQATAKANVRDVILPWDLPVTKGLQESVHAFERLEEEIELRPVLESLATRPPLDATLADDTQARLPLLFGGISVASPGRSSSSMPS